MTAGAFVSAKLWSLFVTELQTRAYSKKFLELHYLLPFLTLPLEVGPLNSASGFRKHCELPPPIGVWDRALAKIEFVHFSFKILHLVTRFFKDLPLLGCTILHLGLRILLPGLDKIG